MTRFPIETQQNFWNEWNASTREEWVGEVSRRQARDVVSCRGSSVSGGMISRSSTSGVGPNGWSRSSYGSDA